MAWRVILSEAKNFARGEEILRFARDDRGGARRPAGDLG